MSPEEETSEISLFVRIKFEIGLLMVSIGHIFVNPGCKMLEIKPVTRNKLYTLLMRHDAERRYSRYGLELILGFGRTYLSIEEFPYPDCVNCDYSADYDAESCICRHPEASEDAKETPVQNYAPIPTFCPIVIKINENTTNGESEK